ncbi:GNAT family N-acetyltransferase [Aquimarina sp. U1-2]|uniref:GNAT family N-acetyltransferase n=1 Tax=Aquimarina sp. U1-2 TaxID=2823141 RepID=UPI001AECE8D9|nr:GNAT family N-acetyltransferase [Aquimarina sp. U1-2]MBP2830908.1 GNAT family N-acetyltransferase [Aquimarina sp. U1-2]
MHYKITKATDTDLPLMQRLFYQTVTMYGAVLFTKAEVKIYSRLATNKIYWQKKFKKDHVYNAKLNGEIVGSFSMDTNGTIEYFFVHMNYHGKGIAKELYSVLEEVAKTSQIEVLTTQIHIATKDFFKNNGFKIIKNAVKVVGGEEAISFTGSKRL